ncbi:S9 family peptidase [Edwardsiella piscicida]|uniref:S9 family peptidase n=1 Tax=Edwardsiella piscicida TaxID=1263550 RepID=UPI00084CBCAB|nr:S9 family peptidase [Edwardsiella piscicida]AOP43103.1 S9 family peptidase [Edwardsiella piscicida]EKS7767076.1 S9 family peptidase [Edwardsiella piscicida]EKS7814063.1 S9 family peptidase [Edwardsiella piscicida]ELM3735017.1 S9 family peptidase [Edwardsiella piscicida]QBB13990.1 S9 family peptidase [Edwardsiella piscicida]
MKKAPKAAKHPYEIVTHGDRRVDDYYWLRDDTRSDPQVLAYLNAENAYSERCLAPQSALRSALLAEMVARIPQQDASVPYVRNGYRYQHRYRPAAEYAEYWRQPESANPESETGWRLLLDTNQRAEGHDFYALGALEVSPDNRLLAVSEDTVSRRQYTLRVKSLTDDDVWLEDTIDGCDGHIEWCNDSRAFYYIRLDPQTLLPYQVYRHRLGTPCSQDCLIYQELDDAFYLGLEKSLSQRYVMIHISSTTTSEVLLLDADDPEARAHCFLSRRRDHEYSLEHYDSRFYIRSNREGQNFALYCGPDGDVLSWQTLVPPRDAVMLEDFCLFHDWLVVEERTHGLTTLRQIRRDGGEERLIHFDDPTYVTWLGYNPQPEIAKLRYGYSSMTTPGSVYELDLNSGERRLLKQQSVADFSPQDYASERIWLRARDGVDVPVSLVYRRDRFVRGQNPILIYGYGAYGSSMDPGFSTSRLSLLDRGFVFALAHVRGGADLGQQWYEDGKLLHKLNSFYDFIDVTQGLVRQGYAAADQVYAMGGSAGGLLVGAVLNMAPQLYRGAVAQVPFVDVLTTMLDASIPLTTGEYDEWGNPEDPEYYHYMRRYSPYDGVQAQAYPHLLVTTGLHDSQVQYWEPAKWVARLREMKCDDNLLLLYTDMEAGHGGKSGRFKAYEDIALEYAFILTLSGVTQ